MGASLGAAVTAQAPDPAGCHASLCYAGALAPFFARLRASRPGDGAPVHILQIGDSQTAGDMITSGWRTRLQARYGGGGRGVLAAGRPYPGYLTWGVTATQSAGWSVNATFGGHYRDGGPWLGMSGFTQTASEAGETLGLTTDTPDQDFDRIIVCAIAQPGGGTLVLNMGTAERRWTLSAPRRTPACRTMDSDAPVASASLTILDSGTVSITSFGAFRREGGAILSNLGVVGAQLVHFGRTSDAVLRVEFAAYRPDLIVLAFGTNEGFSPTLDPDAYEAGLRGAVARIRNLAGHLPILLLGAPDAATREAALDGEDCGDGWHVPRKLGEVRARQQAVARQLGLGFWNWSAAMGGLCASSRWAQAGWMRGDYVHFTRDGGDRIGAMIDADLDRAAESPVSPDSDERIP
ncbi:MAG TPA: GDSL-type esterase/lipase family protein [Allosphingosinicella sp.]|jgi:lysophospholipase L1-like esterase|nr:GDSL-type esterase/lipase family protein [Allosphingosinicella sp.]